VALAAWVAAFALDSRGSPTTLETLISKLIQVLLQANAPSGCA
jgi:hypothetical protein